MTTDYREVGIVLAAGGHSERFGIPKLWVELGGRPIFAHALELFLKYVPGLQIVVTVPRKEFERYQDYIEKHYADTVIPLVLGGDNRTESVWHGLRALPEQIKTVVIHDAARPLLSADAFEKAVALSCEKDAGVILCAPMVDTVKRITSEGTVADTLPRQQLVSVQTPQVFPFARLRNAYRDAVRNGYLFTDDAGLYEAAGHTVHICLNDAPNPKITHTHDWTFIKALFHLDPL